LLESCNERGLVWASKKVWASRKVLRDIVDEILIDLMMMKAQETP